MSTIAAIDVGSNALRMVIGRENSEGTLEIIENLRLPVRLGKDAFSSRIFTEDTMKKAVEAFNHFRKVSQLLEVSQVKAVATSAMREALNSQQLVERIERETGFHLEIISGEEEARLVHLAIRNKIDLQKKTALLIDIGGGSVEVLLSEGDNIVSSESYDMGTVRLLNEVELEQDQKTPAINLLREHAEAARRSINREIGKDRVDICVGTGGNIEEIGRLRKRLLKRQRSDFVTLNDLDELVEILSSMSFDERITKIGLNPDRADVILPAAIVLQMIAREAHIKKIQIPEVGLKDGVLFDLLPRAAAPRLPRHIQLMASVERMGKKYAYDPEHAEATARLAERLFDQCLSLHHLEEDGRLLLSIAARLHDIGHYINTIHHDQHGYYLLMNHPFFGLTEEEREVVANVIFYHRKGNPSASDENCRELSEKNLETVTKLCAILRIADALDTGHGSRIDDAILEKQRNGYWQLNLISQSNGMLENWALEKRKSLFEETFGVTLEVAE